jgi:hypothetical protein
MSNEACPCCGQNHEDSGCHTAVTAPVEPFVIRKEPERNAVIVGLIDGNFIVYVECKDNEKEYLLKDMAKDILQSNVGNKLRHYSE